MVFDILRKKYICLTEEEFVRQAFVNWLISELKYPPSLMANEIGIKLNDTYKRCDTVVFTSKGDPLIIIEYKAPQVKISQTTFDQIVRYNMALNASFLIVSNGCVHYCCRIDSSNGTYSFLGEVPCYEKIKTEWIQN